MGVFGADGTERLQLAGTRRLHGWPQAVGLRTDGRRVLILVIDQPESHGGFRSAIREVDVATGRVVRAHPTGLLSAGPDEWVTGAVADDGSSAVSWTQTDRPTARRTSLDTGSSVAIRIDQRPATTVGFVPLATGVAQRWSDGAVTLYDLSGRPTQVLDVHQDEVNDVVISRDRTWAATVDDSGAVVVWTIDPGTGVWSQRESLVGHSGAVNGVAIDPGGTTLITASLDGTAITWDATGRAGFGSPIPGLHDRWISNTPQEITPGQLVVAPTRPAPRTDVPFLGNEETQSVFATFLDPTTGAVVADVRVARRTEGFFGSSVAVSPDQTAVSVTHGYGATVIDTRTHEVIARVTVPRAGEDGVTDELVWCSTWSPDGSKLLLCADGDPAEPRDGDLVVVDTETWEQELERVPIGGAAQTLELSPDHRLIAVGMIPGNIDDPPPGEVKLLDAETLEVERVLTIGPGDHPLDVAFSPNSTMLAAGGLQGQIAIFDAATGRLLHTPDRVHNQNLTQAGWLPDGRTVVTAGMDGMISLYDARQGLVRVAMPASSEPGSGYTFLTSISESKVTAAVGDNPGRTYSLDPRQWLSYACLVARRDLTEEEWSNYLGERAYQRTCDGVR